MYYRTREDDAWRYQTASSQYGQFYKAMERETRRDKEPHTDCSREVTQLKEQLDEAKACLEMVDLAGPLANQRPYGPRGPCCCEASAQGRQCPCRQKPPGRKNPYALNSLEEWNCGQNPEPSFSKTTSTATIAASPRNLSFPRSPSAMATRTGGAALELEGNSDRFTQAHLLQGVVSTATDVATLHRTKIRMSCPTLHDMASTDTTDLRGKVRRPAKATVLDLRF